ncbi:MAG TPA: ABC transporter permease [Thermoanaerobaculia bacterium]|nr:ABC transporter permease [Thermoanaerobaculia bacterium]
MTTYLVRRLLYAVLTFVGITVATFTLIHAVPGDPISFFIGRGGMNSIPPEMIVRLRHELHLDEPLPAQYARWLRGSVTFDFGVSTVDRRPVRDVIAEKLPNTFRLNALAFLLAAALGVPIGLWSASRSGRLTERASAVGFFLLYSLPSFWVALVLIQLFSVRMHWLPLFGMQSDAYPDLGAGGQFADRLRHLVLPVLTLTYAQLAIFARFTKSALSEVIRQDYITAARAKGAGRLAVMWRHGMRNALLPLITLLGLTIPYLMSGSVIVEQIFQWDGVGLLYYNSILSRDYPVVMALTVVTALLTLVASLVADVLYAFADPRVRLGESAQ